MSAEQLRRRRRRLVWYGMGLYILLAVTTTTDARVRSSKCRAGFLGGGASLFVYYCMP
jgi:hypothetical protein